MENNKRRTFAKYFFMFNYFWGLKKNYQLIIRMIKREVIGRYRGSFLGLLWSFVTPIIMLSIYTFVFSFVFNARWGQGQESPPDFAVMLFSGLIVFNLFSESVSRAPTLILNNISYVKKIIFPLEILPWVSLGCAVFHAAISFLVLLVFLAILEYPFTLAMLWLPVVVLPFLLLIMGLSWFLASLGVFVRDIGQGIGMLMTTLLFLCPIFYPLSSLPESFAQYLYLNPLTLIVDQVRVVLILSGQPDWIKLGYYTIFSMFFAWSGWFWFVKTQKGFADVL